MKKALPFLLAVVFAYGNEVRCNIENERIFCRYFIDRSDNSEGKRVEFHWYSPSGEDDRIRIFEIPPYYGSVYDYRYLPGRESGEWRVVVTDLDSNVTATATFKIEAFDEEFFED